MTTAPLSPEVLMLKDKVIEILLYGCVMQTLCAQYFDKLQLAHCEGLLRVIGFQCRADHSTLSYAKALKKTQLRHNARVSTRPQ